MNSKYTNTHILSDGRVLEICYYLDYDPGDYHNPPYSSVSETEFKIDNQEVYERDLPLEVCSQLIERLESAAKEVGYNYWEGSDSGGLDGDENLDYDG